jgi:rubrerythrin
LHAAKYGEIPEVMREQPADYVEFFATGDAALGHFQCSECSYGVAIQSTLPPCPMCGGRVWEVRAEAAPLRRLQ